MRTAESREELESWIEASSFREEIRIWIFSSSEWITLAAYRKQFPLAAKKHKLSIPEEKISRKSVKMHWSGKLVYTSIAAVSLFLIFNFTRIEWKSAGSMSFTADRPSNVTEMDID